MVRSEPIFRSVFASGGGAETVRAFALFGVLVVSILVIGGELVFRQLGLDMLREHIDLGRQEARRIAREVVELARVGDIVDYSEVRQNRSSLQRWVEQRLSRRRFIRYVEISDRFGVRLLMVGDDARPPEEVVKQPAGLPALSRDMIRVPLLEGGARPEGEVRLGISPEALQQELEVLRRSLRLKVALAGVFALVALFLGLLYVLHLIRKNRRLEQARQAAARASYVGLLASGLAHEIRNPLNAMNMNLQMLEEELQASSQLADPEQVELLDSTKTEIKRLERLVNNFLAYARPARPRLETKDLNQVVRDVSRFLDADFRQHRVELSADLDPALPDVEIDETQFRQALINLLFNARQVLKDGGSVTVRTRASSSGEVVAEVSDDGPGVPEEARDRIFEVFYSRRGGGTGLGLPIAKQIVERHGGTIELDGKAGRGATFRIRLPRRSKTAPAPASREEEAGG